MNKSWDAEQYAQLSTIQEKAALEFLDRYYHLAGTETILDIGCGDGRITHHLAEQTQETVIGVDPSPDMFNYARTHYQRDNLRFEHLRATELSFQDQFDIVVSFSALQWEHNQNLTLERIHQALKPGGRAIYFLWTMSECFWTPMYYLSKQSKWSSYFTNFINSMGLFEATGYENIVDNSPLDKISVKSNTHEYYFNHANEVINAVKSFSPYYAYVPNERVAEFDKDLVELFQQALIKTPDGKLFGTANTIEVVVSKPS